MEGFDNWISPFLAEQSQKVAGICRTQKLCGAQIQNEMQPTAEWLKEYLNEGQIVGKLPGQTASKGRQTVGGGVTLW